VSGGVKGAELGTLCFMVGAKERAWFEEAEELLGSMGQRIIDCKGTGQGQVAKMCNNMAMAAEMVAVSEALLLGKANGMDPGLLTEVMKVSSSRCWSVDSYNPVPGLIPGIPSSRDYERGFAN
jgi:3-hydroxyisobutyrate dehydrogenase-like beta-hydroxyacid dehydrogenase